MRLRSGRPIRACSAGPPWRLIGSSGAVHCLCSAIVYLCISIVKPEEVWAGGSDHNERRGSHAAAGALPGCPAGASQQQHSHDRSAEAAAGAASRGCAVPACQPAGFLPAARKERVETQYHEWAGALYGFHSA